MKTFTTIINATVIGMIMGGYSMSVQAFDLTLDGEINPLVTDNTGCWAYSPHGGDSGNVFIAGVSDNIKIVVTASGKVNAYCHAQDNSGGYETEAEQTKVEKCGITLVDGTVIIGSGHVVAAANNGEFEGGSIRLHCSGWLY